MRLNPRFCWLMRKDLVELCCDGLKTLLPEDELQNKIGGGALVEDDKAKRSALEERHQEDSRMLAHASSCY